MPQKRLLTKSSFASQKKYSIPQSSLNQTQSQQHEKPPETQDEKSICEKYLNVYESIKRKQGSQTLDRFKKITSKTHQIYSSIHKRGIFENSLIQNHYPKNIKQTQTQSENQSMLASKQNHHERLTTIPSKKNQMTLRIMAQNKQIKETKNSQTEFQDIKIKGTLAQQQSSIQDRDYKLSANKTLLATKKSAFYDQSNIFYPAKQSSSYWQTNIFVGCNTKKAYTGYYKAKNKKIYEQQKQKLYRNSTTFIKKIDRAIQQEKARHMIRRPQTTQNKGSITDKNKCQIDWKVTLQQIRKDFGNEEKLAKSQSEAKTKNYCKQNYPRNEKKVNYFGLVRKSKTPYNSNSIGFLFNGKENIEFQRKNAKKFTFHCKTNSFSKNNQVDENDFCMLGITTQSALKSSMMTWFPTQQTCENSNHKNYIKSKKLQKKYRENELWNQKLKEFERHTEFSGQRQSLYTRNPKQMTLNKIQETIQNDLQIMIKQITPSE